MSRRSVVRAVAVLCLAAAPAAQAATTRVTSLSALQSAIDGAASGDTIVLASGSYSASTAIGVSRSNLTIAAETVGGATISGSASFAVKSPASNVTIRGFRLTTSVRSTRERETVM
jgi:poly(beta-D-mannuronate) lyase